MPPAAPVTRAAGMPPTLPCGSLQQACEALVPGRADVGHPAHRVHQRGRSDRVTGLPALAVRLDEAGLLKGGEVLGHGLAGDRQLAGEPRRGQLRPLGDRAQDRAARRVREGEEDFVYAGQSDAWALIAISFGPQVTVSAA